MNSNIDNSFKENFNTLFDLSVALKNCIFLNEDLIINQKVNLQFTEIGKKLFTYLEKKTNVDSNIIKIAIFMDFYHEDYYFIINEANINEIKSLINHYIIKCAIHYPWVYGKHLYDKYYEEFELQEHELSYNETYKLLKNTYKGVFQLNKIIISPFGLLESKVIRNILPQNEMQLWHCSDPSCPSFHTTKFNNDEESIIFNLIEYINEFNSYKDPMDLVNLIELDSDNEYYGLDNLNDMYKFIANSFNIDEQRKILLSIIDKEDIRRFLPLSLQKGSSSNIVKGLSEDQCLSLLLISDNLTLFNHIETLINEKIIIIPDTEIRELKNEQGFGLYENFIQCNKLGIRVNSLNTDISLTRLKKLIKEVNNESPYKEQLEWKLRSIKPSSFDQKLSNYIIEKTPIEAIRDTIYNGPVQLEKAFSSLLGMFSMPMNQNEEDKLIEKIAWKLGFDINLFPPHLKGFWEKLSIFKSDVLKTITYNENDKARIRSSSVNLFVSMEDILQQSLSFIYWAFFSDHYIDTKFTYVYEDARQFMISKLDNFEYSSGEFLKFDKSGKNTLFPLICGFSVFNQICSDIDSNIQKYKRPIYEFPDYYNNDPIRIFPFEHKVLILDLIPSEFKKIKESITLITSEFGKGHIIEIRNKLQHNREDFPNQKEILQAISSIEISFSMLENLGLYPNVYLFEKLEKDKFKKIKTTVTNYKQCTVDFYFTPELDGINLPNVNKPLIVIDSLSIGLSNHPIIFSYKEKSNYHTYWKDYPRKKINKLDVNSIKNVRET